MSSPDSRIVPFTIEPQIKENGITWQVYERLYPGLPNLYEVAEQLVIDINHMVAQPDLTAEERWLFEPKNSRPPDIAFMAFEDQQKTPICLIFDHQFSLYAMSVGHNVVVVPMGKTHEVIYRRYQAAKLGSAKHIPPVPREFIQGYLSQSTGSFILDSIFRYGWDAKQQFAAAKIVKGFPTKAYDEIYFLGNFSAEYREQKIAKLIRQYHMPDSVKSQFEILFPSKS